MPFKPFFQFFLTFYQAFFQKQEGCLKFLGKNRYFVFLDQPEVFFNCLFFLSDIGDYPLDTNLNKKYEVNASLMRAFLKEFTC